MGERINQTSKDFVSDSKTLTTGEHCSRCRTILPPNTSVCPYCGAGLGSIIFSSPFYLMGFLTFGILPGEIGYLLFRFINLAYLSKLYPYSDVISSIENNLNISSVIYSTIMTALLFLIYKLIKNKKSFFPFFGKVYKIHLFFNWLYILLIPTIYFALIIFQKPIFENLIDPKDIITLNAVKEYNNDKNFNALQRAADMDNEISKNIVNWLIYSKDTLLVNIHRRLYDNVETIIENNPFSLGTDYRSENEFRNIRGKFKDSKNLFNNLTLSDVQNYSEKIKTIVFVDTILNDIGYYEGTGPLNGMAATQWGVKVYVVDMQNRKISATYSIWGSMPSKKVSTDNPFSSSSGSMPSVDEIEESYNSLPINKNRFY